VPPLPLYLNPNKDRPAQRPGEGYIMATTTNNNTVSVTYYTDVNPVATADFVFREDCPQAAINTLVYGIQAQTNYLANHGTRVKGVTKTQARNLATVLIARVNALGIMGGFQSCPELISCMTRDIDAALLKALTALT
jgi:hypothetical protein